MSKTQGIIPITCKQLNSICVDSNNQVKLGHFTLSHIVSLVCLAVNVDDSTGKTVMSIEDGTALVESLEFYGQERPQEFAYIEIFVQISAGQDGIQKYVQSMRTVDDYNQITNHLLNAYTFHLRNCLSPEPHLTQKQFVKNQEEAKQSQQQQQQMHSVGFGQSATSAFGQTFTGMGSHVGSMAPGGMSGPSSGAAAAAANPKVAVLEYLQQYAGNDGLTVQDTARALQLPETQVHKIIHDYLDEGTVFTSTDDFHFAAC